ncbi:MAG: Rho termination factor N-terminal domain-containing protein [Brumimicrobium sp.]|nr:Rho termination factor N-terminal domain-containing protein [Brumimicrobium sp.]
MSAEIKNEGKFELFKTNEDNEILSYDGNNYAFIEGKKGDIIVYSDTDYSDKKENMIAQGKFYYVDFEDDENFNAMPHFFMEHNDHFREILLPNGFPTAEDKQKKLVRVDEELPKEKVFKSLGISRNKEVLKKKNKDELYDMAKEEDIDGRSEMTKEELINELVG